MDYVKTWGRGFSSINWSWNICQIKRTLTMPKNHCRENHKFHDFLTLRANRPRLGSHKILERAEKRCAVVSLSQIYSVWHLLPKFYDISVSHDPITKSKIVKFVILTTKIFRTCQSTFNLTDVPDSMYDRKTPADLLTLSTTFYELTVSCNLLSKVEPKRLRLSGTDGPHLFSRNTWVGLKWY